MSSYASTYTNHLTSWISNDIARKTVDSALSGSIAGFGFGSVLSLGQGNSFGQAIGDGLNDAAMGFTVGAIGGLGNAVIEQRLSKITHNNIVSDITPEDVIKSVLMSPKTPTGTGTCTVYLGKDEFGIIRYVGITVRDPAVRFAEHLRSGTNRSYLHFDAIEGTGHLNSIQGRIIEQNIINIYKLNKNGGLLYNKINSISPKFWDKYNIFK